MPVSCHGLQLQSLWRIPTAAVSRHVFAQGLGRLAAPEQLLLRRHLLRGRQLRPLRGWPLLRRGRPVLHGVRGLRNPY